MKEMFRENIKKKHEHFDRYGAFSQLKIGLPLATLVIIFLSCFFIIIM